MRFFAVLALFAAKAQAAGPTSCYKGCDNLGDNYLGESGRPDATYLTNACEVEQCSGDAPDGAPLKATTFLDLTTEEAEFCLTVNIPDGTYANSKSSATGEMVVTRAGDNNRFIALGCNNARSKAEHKARYEALYAGATLGFTESQGDNKCQANSDVLFDPSDLSNIVKCNYGMFNKGPWKYCHEVLCMHKDDKCISIKYEGDPELGGTWESGFGCVSDTAAVCTEQGSRSKFLECGTECATKDAPCNTCTSGAFDKPAPSGVAIGILAVALLALQWATSN
jgi:hypothetical protein